MRKSYFLIVSKINLLFLLVLASGVLFSQSQAIASKTKSEFWKNVQFGGGFGLNVGSGFTDITVAPSGIYNFNQSFSLGIGLQGSYVSSKNNFSSVIYGLSLISLMSRQAGFIILINRFRWGLDSKEVMFPQKTIFLRQFMV